MTFRCEPISRPRPAVAGGGAPVINGGSPLTVNFVMPSESGQQINALSATNSPTSWAITSGNGSGFLALSNAGVLTVTGTGAPSTGLSVGDHAITVTATNASGTSSPCTVTVSVASLPWPAASIRPSVSGSTINWTGPTAGGPSTASDGSQSHALTTGTSLTTSSNGQIIEYRDLSGDLTIAHNNVTFRRGRVVGTIIVDSSVTGWTIEDVDFGSIDCGTSFMTGGMVRRCFSHGVENNITKNLVNIYVKDTYFTGASGSDCDFVEMDAGSSGVVCCNDTFEGPATSGFLNSGMNGTNFIAVGSPGNDVSFMSDRCRYINMTDHPPINDDNNQGPGEVFGSYTNNGVFNCAQNFGAPLFSGDYKLNRSVDVVNAGNILLDSVNAQTGSLINGDGKF